MCVYKEHYCCTKFFLDLGCAPHPLKLYKQNKLLCTSHPCNEDTCGCAFPIALYRAEGTRLTDQRLPKQTRGVYDLISLCLSIYIYIYICESKNDLVAFCPVRWELKGSAGRSLSLNSTFISPCQNILFFCSQSGQLL